MSELELIGKSVFFAVLVGCICGGFFHWGWQERAKLARKIEFFGITNTKWHQYDVDLNAGHLAKDEGQHNIREWRRSER